MDDALILEKLKKLIKDGNNLGNNLYPATDINVKSNRFSYQIAEKWKLSSINLLKLRFGIHSDYFQNFFDAINTNYHSDIKYVKENVQRGTGALEYVYDALESGLIDDLFYKREILVFSELLEQAYEFLDSGLDLASAIYGRIVIETTIKEYALKNNIKNSKDLKFDQLIIKLRQEGVIQQPFEIALRGNYKIGSWATHGDKEFENVTHTEIKEFLNFIRDKVLTLE
ncbi:MAG: hypothetical protein V3U19_07585 [Thermodesulfobacteriota bacterium]